MNRLCNIKLSLLTGITLLMSSCSSWLDVDPEDKILSSTLFKNKAGFTTALNGVYAELNDPALYGENLTTGMIDVMAQYYNFAGTSHSFAIFNNYNYTAAEYKARFDAIWSNLYSLIADCNVIIEQCSDGNSVLPDNYYRLIKGESIALRAMLHFDLLRMFGPVWSENENLSIPYMTKADRTIQPLLSATEVINKIIADLTEASELLSTVDPVLTEGAKNEPSLSGGNDWNYRQYRLNYFAVQALLARAYLWEGDKTKAGVIARNVITQAQPFFPLVNAEYMSENPDRVFSPEVLFSLYNTSRTEKVYNKLFNPSLPLSRILRLQGDIPTGRMAYIYDDQNDYRYKMWRQTVIDNESVTYYAKYQDEIPESSTGVILNPQASGSAVKRDANTFRYMIPLVRLSEMYLIAVECEPDIRTALDKYVNPFRYSRNCVNLNFSTPEEMTAWIKAEYTREFVGEGQLFFYFKRNKLQNIPDGSFANKTKSMVSTSYVFPLPDSEISQRIDSNEN